MGVYISDVQMAVFSFQLWPYWLLFHSYCGTIIDRELFLVGQFWWVIVWYFIWFVRTFWSFYRCRAKARLRNWLRFKYNVHPFTFVREFINYSPFRLSNVHTWIPAIKDATLIQPLFNVFLTVPFGVYLRIYFKRSFKQAVLFSFLLSLFFELTQLSGLYGIYPRPYRLFDVDDLMLNTLGGTIGFLISGTLKNIIPNAATMQHTMQIKSQKVSILDIQQPLWLIGFWFLSLI